ncbi:putative forkhead box protein I2-like [Scophthalmus maximus]|uniref:Putative forkhead box protein I2-like n=1 Tax=Scophthalmus maximus TaxID=52904 RepID=A0A2U9B6S2_SCOMX|nr:putative forkhead box protein I2-like [Scophthalmus maximus]
MASFVPEQGLSPPPPCGASLPQQELPSLGLDPSDFSLYSPPAPPEAPWLPPSGDLGDSYLCYSSPDTGPLPGATGAPAGLSAGFSPALGGFFPHLFSPYRPLPLSNPWLSLSSPDDLLRLSTTPHFCSPLADPLAGSPPLYADLQTAPCPVPELERLQAQYESLFSGGFTDALPLDPLVLQQ